MMSKSCRVFSLISYLLLFSYVLGVKGVNGKGESRVIRSFTVKKEERRSVVDTEYGGVGEVRISDGTKGPHYLQFITLEPNSLFLPVLLHSDMVFYVHSGSGSLSWTDEDKIRRVDLRRGDVYRLYPGSVFFVQSDLESEREKLRIYAIFSNSDDDVFEPAIGAYSSISDLVLGFDRRILLSAFQVPDDVIEELFNSTRPPPMVHALPTEKKTSWKLEARFLKAFLGQADDSLSNKKKKTKAFNVLDSDPDFKNCNGWSTAVGKKDLHLLKGSNIGVFMVNLTKGSMMGPHWNPSATEIAIVLHGQGMIRVICPSNAGKTGCKNKRFRVEEGDVFAVPRFHPMAQMSFNNDSFVFMGFSTTVKKNYPQFIAGKSSVLQALNKDVLAVSFNVSNTTVHRLVAAQAESVILDCTSCAEEEESIMEEEIRREREEEERRRKEEEARRREEEERRQKEEERRKREEEEQAERRRQEEERQRREEEGEEERERREREQKEEEARSEEEQARREQEEREREREEEIRRREEEEEEERRRHEKEETERREREEEPTPEEEQEAESRHREEEEARRQQEERERRRREEEEEERRRHAEEERERREREEEQEDERRQREEKEARRQHEERERRRREEERRRHGGGGGGRAEHSEEEEARRQQEERERRRRQEDEEMERGYADLRLPEHLWELSQVSLA